MKMLFFPGSAARLVVVSVLGWAALLTFAVAAGAQAPRHAPNSHAASGTSHGQGRHDKSVAPLVRAVREATARFKDVARAEAEGYTLMFGCVSGSEYGAMGLHYVNMALVADGELDPSRPEIVIYEPQPNGRLQLVGADFLVFADAWHARNTDTPKLMGQLLHLFESPNRYGLPPFYTLHVWAWRDNPNGSFANWHPKVSCDAYKAPM